MKGTSWRTKSGKTLNVAIRASFTLSSKANRNTVKTIDSFNNKQPVYTEDSGLKPRHFTQLKVTENVVISSILFVLPLAFDVQLSLYR